MILADKPLIFEVVLSQRADGGSIWFKSGDERCVAKDKWSRGEWPWASSERKGIRRGEEDSPKDARHLADRNIWERGDEVGVWLGTDLRRRRVWESGA
jgi:hypothetical protein